MRRSILGLMSGTSLDGVDLCLAVFEETSYRIMEARTFAYPNTWKQRLMEAPSLSGLDLVRLHAQYGTYLGNLCQQFLTESGLKADAVASHGHTLFHLPQEQLTFQIGDGAYIAAATQTDCIYDFRKLDVALSGQGAPLVPIGDELLFSTYTYCLNIGGFSNLSENTGNQRIAFDICPSNIVLNEFCQHLPHGYDDKGQLARSGKVNPLCLEKLNALPFYQLTGARSLGREWVEQEIFPVLRQAHLSPEDLLCTYTEHIAQQIGRCIRKPGSCLTTGGGAWNDYLIERIQHYSVAEICIPEPEIVNFKEALIFAFLGYLFLENKTNTLHSVTGAISDSVGGILCKAPV